jgi:hypothetical protein
LPSLTLLQLVYHPSSTCFHRLFSLNRVPPSYTSSVALLVVDPGGFSTSANKDREGRPAAWQARNEEITNAHQDSHWQLNGKSSPYMKPLLSSSTPSCLCLAVLFLDPLRWWNLRHSLLLFALLPSAQLIANFAGASQAPCLPCRRIPAASLFLHRQWCSRVSKQGRVDTT